MADEDIAEFYKDDLDKDTYVPLDEIPVEEIDAANRAVKEQRSERLNLTDPDKLLLDDMADAQRKVQGEATIPVTTLDYERISEEQGGPDLGTVPPRDIGAVGLVPSVVKETPFVRQVAYQSGEEQVSGIMPDDNLWFNTNESGQPMPEGTEFRFLRKKEKMTRTGSKEVGNIFGGTIRVPIPTAEGELNLYVNVEGTMDEINSNIRTLRTKWREREGMDLANPKFKSTPEIPLTFTNYGLNIQAETNVLNDVTGYSDNVVKMYLSRGAQKIAAPVYDIVVDQFFGTLVPSLVTAVPATLNFLVQSVSTKGRFGQQYQDVADDLWAKRDAVADFVPSSVEILKSSIEKPTLQEYAAGQISFNEENLARFIEGKNASFVEKFATDYLGGLAFVKLIDNAILPIMGRGPRAAEDFVAMIRGDLSMDTGKVGRELTKVFKENSQLKTGKQLYLDASKKSGKTEIQLLKEWNKLPSTTKDKWASQAFNTFLKVRIDNKGGFISRKIKEMGNKSRWETGVSVPAYAKNTRLGEKLASLGGVTLEEHFGPWGYMLGAITTAGGGPILMNRNWYARTKNTRLGSFALAAPEFGTGFASGLDALAFAVTGRRPITKSQFDNAAAQLRKEGMPAALIEEEVYRKFAIQNPDAKPAQLGAFMIIDKDGNERLATSSDPEWKKLNEIVTDINKIVDPIQKGRITSTLEVFLNIQNGFADEIQATGQRWLADNPGKTLIDHPLNKLGASLFEVLDLVTTRSAAESMIEGADYGFKKGINLNLIENSFQERKDQLLAIGEYISEATEFMSKYNVAEENMDLLTGLDSFIKAENTYTDAVQAELQSLPTVFSRMHNVNSFDSVNKLTGESHFAQDYYNNDISYNLFKRNFNKVKGNIVKLEIENRRTVYNVLNHMKNDISAHTPEGKVQTYNRLVGVVNDKIKTEAGLIYAPFLRSAGNNPSKISGKEVDNLFLNINEIIDSTAESRLAKEVLPVSEASTLDDVFSSALRKNGDKVRQAVEETYPDLNLEQIKQELNIPVDLTDDVGLYRYFLKNANAVNEDIFLKAVKENFGNLEMDAVTIANMDRVIRAERSMLLAKLGKGQPLTKDEEGALNQYYKIIGKGEDEFGTLGTVINKNMGEEVLANYKVSARIYATAIAPRRWGDFNRLYEKVERVNKQIEEAGDGFDRGTANVYTIEETRQLEMIGETLINNPQFGVRMLTEKIGSLASVNGQQTFIIATAEQADTFRILSRMAINTHLEKKFKGKMQKLNQKYGEDGIKNKDITGELAEEFKALGQGGEIHGAFIEMDKLSRIPDGALVWTGDIDDQGKLVFGADAAYTVDSNNKTLSSLSENYGKPVLIAGDESIDDIFFGKDIDLMIKNDKSIKGQMESLENEMSRYNTELKKYVDTETSGIQRNNKVLVDYFSQNIGLEAAPEGVAGAFNIDTAVNSMISDGTGRKMDGFINHLENLKDPNTGSYVLKGSAKRRKEQAKNYVENLVQYQFANDILVDSGLQRTALNSATGEIEMVSNYIPDLSLINRAKEKYLPILEKFMSPEQAKKYIRIAELGAITSSVGGIGPKSGLSTRMTNIPTRMSISGMLSRGMNMARHVVSPQWVGVDALIRRTRLNQVGTLKTLLLTKSTAQYRGVTVVDAVYDMLLNGNYSVKNATVLKKLLPEAIYQSELTFEGFGEIMGLPVTPEFGRSDRYAPREELGDKPLIAREGESGESQLSSRINEEFGNFPSFIKAVQEGDRKAIERQKLINRQDSSLRDQMNQLLN